MDPDPKRFIPDPGKNEEQINIYNFHFQFWMQESAKVEFSEALPLIVQYRQVRWLVPFKVVFKMFIYTLKNKGWFWIRLNPELSRISTSLKL